MSTVTAPPPNPSVPNPAVPPWLAKVQQAEKLFDQNQWDEAWRLAGEVLVEQPLCAAAHQVQGLILARRNRPYEAIPRLHQAIGLRSDLVPSHNDLGLCYSQLGDLTLAAKHFDSALTLQPDHPFARFNRALLWLKQNRIPEGWVEYEWRWTTGQVSRPEIPRPRWDGSPLRGNTLLVHTEQGIGDVLQFIRFLPQVKRDGARIALACQKVLIPFLKQLNYIDEWFPIDQQAPITFDCYLPLLSLPAVLRIGPEQIQTQVPYLFAEQARIDRWRPIIDDLPGKIKIGMSWQGSPTHKGDALRSIPLAAFEPLAKRKDVTLVSFQKGHGEEQIEANADRVPVTVFPDRDADGAFLDTAAIMQHLDLVIACDTSVAHLAGALGRPTWTLVSVSNDWRWLVDREDSPWYPTMRVFRQSQLGQWSSVIDRVGQEIDRLLEAKVG